MFKEVEHLGIRFKVNEEGTVYVYKHTVGDYVLAKAHYNADGYLVVGGYDPNSQRNKYVGVHILVAKAFIPNPNHLPEVNHKDFDRANPRVENLEWITHADNVRYSRNAGRYPSQVGELNSNYGNRTLHNKYMADKELAKEKQSRPMGQNGRARKCKLYHDEDLLGEFGCQREAVYYLFDKGLLKRVKLPEGIIQNMKRPQGYKGYHLAF